MSKPIKVPVLTLYAINRVTGAVKEPDDPLLAGPRRTYGWRLKGANGEKICRHSQGGGFKTARSAWSNFGLVMLIGGTVMPTVTPKKGTDMLFYKGPFNRVLSAEQLEEEVPDPGKRGAWSPWLRVRRAS